MTSGPVPTGATVGRIDLCSRFQINTNTECLAKRRESIENVRRFLARMEMHLPERNLACSFILLALLSGCDRVPDCDSQEANALMRTTVYTMVKNELRGAGSLRIEQQQKPVALQISDRHQAMIDMYQPHIAIAFDREWLRQRLEAEAPDPFKSEHFSVYLMLNDYRVIREAVKVSLAQHEPLPDRTEGERVYRKVCRAKLTITPAIQSSRTVEPISLTYSLNPSPRSSRTSAASPLYVAVNFFEATEPPLPFSLSDSEKVALMAMGAVKDIQAVPRPQSPETRVTKQALRAFRTNIESKEATVREAPNPSIWTPPEVQETDR